MLCLSRNCKINKSKLCTLACYNYFYIYGEKPCLLNCPFQCIDTPKSHYCIMVLNENIDIAEGSGDISDQIYSTCNNISATSLLGPHKPPEVKHFVGGKPADPLGAVCFT